MHVPRIARRHLVAKDTTNHCTWRAHNLSFVFNSDEEFLYFRSLLKRHKEKYGIEFRSYTLMSSHPHTVCRTTKSQKDFSRFWQVVNGSYARWYNRRHGRKGQVVMDRMKSPLVQDDQVRVLTVMRYGDLNPVRAGMVKSPKDWKWSSYRHYAFGEPDDLIDDAPEYLALGKNGPARRKAYQALFAVRFVGDLLWRREDLVQEPFVGDDVWRLQQYARTGLSPPS